MNSVKKGKDPTQSHKKVVLPEDRPGIQDKDANKQIKKESKKSKSGKKTGLFGFGKPKKADSVKRSGGPKRRQNIKNKKHKEIMDDDFSDTTMIDSNEVKSALDDNNDTKVVEENMDSPEVEEKPVEDIPNSEKPSSIKREVVSLDSEDDVTDTDANLVVDIIRGDVIDSEPKKDIFLNTLIKSAKSLSLVPLVVEVKPDNEYLDNVFEIEDNKTYLSVQQEVEEDTVEEDVFANPSVVDTRRISTEDRETVREKASSFQKESINNNSKRERPLAERRNAPRGRSRQRKRKLEDLLV